MGYRASAPNFVLARSPNAVVSPPRPVGNEERAVAKCNLHRISHGPYSEGRRGPHSSGGGCKSVHGHACPMADAYDKPVAVEAVPVEAVCAGGMETTDVPVAIGAPLTQTMERVLGPLDAVSADASRMRARVPGMYRSVGIPDISRTQRRRRRECAPDRAHD